MVFVLFILATTRFFIKIGLQDLPPISFAAVPLILYELDREGDPLGFH